MPENRNSLNGFPFDGRGTVCIDTNRVLDCCRDRDCFEDARVYLTERGQSTVAGANSVRTRDADLIWAYVGVDEVPFNNGFFQITVRYYIGVELECCTGIGQSENVYGLCIAEKNVILFGGEGNATSYSSDPLTGYCDFGDFDNISTNDPTAVVDTVSPIVLSTKVVCECDPCVCGADLPSVPEIVKNKFKADFVQPTEGVPRVYVTVGIFSTVRLQRPARLLVNATDYSVPEKECPGISPENPCSVFHSMAFPVSSFRGYGSLPDARPASKGFCQKQEH